MANVDVLKAKYALRTISFTTSEGWDLKVWDAIDVSNDELAVSGKFKVLNKDISTDQENIGYVTITAVEAPDAMYDGIDPGVWSPGGVINFPELSVLPPTNLQAVKKGNTTSGSVVDLTWDASPDPYLRGYYVYYKLNSSSTWIYAGSTGVQKLDYELFGLTDTGSYDFAVEAYNNLGLVSQKLSLIGIVPTFNFALPAVTGVVLANKTESALVTDAPDFNIRWDSQKNLLVNGRSFSEYFKYYIINIYSGTTLVDTFYTQSNTFNLTLAMNRLKIRKPTIGIIAQGFNTGTYSQEVKITVENKQAGLVTGVSFTGGFGNLFASWTKSDERDYAGAVISIVNGTTTRLFTSYAPEFDSIPNITDGEYTVKMGFFDVFGTDNIQYSPEQIISINSKYQFTQDDADEINSILDLDDRLTDTINNAVNESNEYTNTQVNIVKNQVNDNTASIGTLTQTVADNNTAQTQALTQLTSSVNGQMALLNKSNFC